MRILLRNQIIEYGPLRGGPAQQREEVLAREIAADMNRRAEGKTKEDPETWRLVAREMNCTVYSFYAPLGTTVGEYAPTRAGTGVITVNTALTPYRQCRVLVHEIAHHLLLIRGVVIWVDAPNIVKNDHIGDDYRHRIARMVETLILD